MMKYGLKDVADVILYHKNTGEKIETFNVETLEVKTERELEGQYFGKVYSESIFISKIFIGGESQAYLYGLDREPEIVRLIKLHNKTKNKRIKKKLNKRILNEVDKHLF